MDIENLDYEIEAKEKWGTTKEYKEFEEKNKSKSKEKFDEINSGLMEIFKDIGALKNLSESDKKIQEKIKLLQEYITNNFYKCTNEILMGLGQMYVNDERFKNNINNIAGEGTAEFVSRAIKIYCLK